jgi:transposase
VDDGPGHPRLRVDAKKKTLTAAERDEGLRATFRLDRALDLDPADVVSVDEAAATLALTRRYARAPKGERATGSVPRNHGTPTTLVTALSPTGLQAAMTLVGALDKVAFRLFIRDLRAPTLRPGQVVLLDNLSIHRDPEVRALSEARACVLLHLPTYSPDLAPVEMAIAKIKAYLRRVAARTQDALDQAITAARALITPEDARGFFEHAGYPCRPNHHARRSRPTAALWWCMIYHTTKRCQCGGGTPAAVGRGQRSGGGC